MPNGSEPALQALVFEARGDLREIRLQTAADQTERRGDGGLIAGVISELHGPASVEGLTGGVNGDGERAIQIFRDPRFI